MGSKDLFYKLSNYVSEYIKEADVKSYDDLSLMRRLTNILLEDKDVHYNFKFKIRYSFKEIDKIVSDFLETINPSYKDYYEIRKNDGTFNFDYNCSYDTAYSTYDFENNKRIIYIPMDNTLDDAYSIVHELMHDINLDVEGQSVTRMFYTEALSILSELLLEDYLKETKIKQYNNSNDYGLHCIKMKALEVDFNIKLIDKYLCDGYIDASGIIDVLNNYSSVYTPNLVQIIYNIVSNEGLTLDEEQPYIIGALVATYMYDRIKSNNVNLNELFELNDMLKEYTFDQVLDYLDIDYNDIELSYGAYIDLENKYRNYKKNRYR